MQNVYDNDRFCGFLLEKSHWRVFFGARNFGLLDIKALFPQTNFFSLKQVHGQKIIACTRSPERPEADGHFCSEPRQGLLIETADCLPVMFCHAKKVVAVHAGWRGLAGGIFAEACKIVSNTKDWQVLIGPHIQVNSFEVGLDVAEQLLSSNPKNMDSPVKWHEDPAKKKLDLAKLAHAQLTQKGFSGDQVSNLLIDTFTDPRFASFRRDKASAGRNISFVELL